MQFQHKAKHALKFVCKALINSKVMIISNMLLLKGPQKWHCLDRLSGFYDNLFTFYTDRS